MTCSYDGHLIVPRGKGILPCCASMHKAIIMGVVYRGSISKSPCVSIRLDSKKGSAIVECPWCRAVPEVEE